MSIKNYNIYIRHNDKTNIELGAVLPKKLLYLKNYHFLKLDMNVLRVTPLMMKAY